MITPFAAIQAYVARHDLLLNSNRYVYVFYFSIVFSALLVAFAVVLRTQIGDALKVSELSPQSRSATAKIPPNTTSTQTSYLISEQKTKVTINGQEVSVPQDKDTHITIPLSDGEATVDARSSTTQDEKEDVSVSSNVEVRAHSSSERIDEDSR